MLKVRITTFLQTLPLPDLGLFFPDFCFPLLPLPPTPTQNTPQASLLLSSWLNTAATSIKPPAFVFDIDGVLLRGSTVLSQGKRALSLLLNNNRTWRFPVAFLTNGGGMTEESKAKQLSSYLNAPINANMVILGHTPYKTTQFLPEAVKSSPCLVIGRGQHIRSIAEGYGFRDVLTTDQLVASLTPSALPFFSHHQHHHHCHHHENENGGDSKACQAKFSSSSSLSSSTTTESPIRSVVVFNDPEQWYINLQLIIDVITTDGTMTTLKLPSSMERTTNDKHHHHRQQQRQQKVKVYFAHQDILWANDHPLPRFGQGAFASCVEALYEKVTGTSLQCKFFGKPNVEPYILAEGSLLHQAYTLGYIENNRNDRPLSSSSSSAAAASVFSHIYAIGDNCDSDIKGANNRGHPWFSVLVKTGVFVAVEGEKEGEEGGGGGNCPYPNEAHIVVDDAEEAVKAGLHRYRNSKWHSMR